MEYRIKEIITGNGSAFYVQYRFLFIWFNCKFKYWMGGTGIHEFASIKYASKFIQKQKDKNTVKTMFHKDLEV